MRSVVGRYGASPLHLLGHLVCFAFAGYALVQLAGARAAGNIFLWLLAAVVLHDFLVLPVYSLLDRAAQAGTPRGRAVNYVRVPVVVSAVLFLVFFPAILGSNDGSFARVAGLSPGGYAVRWLVATAVVFALSALLYVIRGRRAAAPPPPSR